MRSTKGIKIDAALAAGGGLQWNRIGDRTFRLIDAKNGVTLGCKIIPKLLKITTTIAGDIIYFNIEGLRYTYVTYVCTVRSYQTYVFLDEKTEFELDFADLRMSSTTEAIDCGDEAAKWFGTFIGKDCR